MENNFLAKLYAQELQTEYTATRKCLENISETLFDYKPHPKSMAMGYLALLVAEIPLWIKHMVVDSEIDFVTFKHFSPKTNAELVSHYEENIEAAKQALQNTTDEALQAPFQGFYALVPFSRVPSEPTKFEPE